MPEKERRPIYRVEYTLALPDPHVPHVERHTVLFIQTSRPSPGCGIIHHVTGDITSRTGMRYESKLGRRPEDSDTFHSSRLLGYTTASEDDWEQFLKGVRPPPQQKAFNVKSRCTEPFKTLNPLVFYERGEARKTLSKCTEWVDWAAVPALVEAGLLQLDAGKGEGEERIQSRSENESERDW